MKRPLRSFAAASILAIGTVYILKKNENHIVGAYRSSYQTDVSITKHAFTNNAPSQNFPPPNHDSPISPPRSPLNELPGKPIDISPPSNSLQFPATEEPKTDSPEPLPFNPEFPFQQDLTLDLPASIREFIAHKPHNYITDGPKSHAYATFMATRNPSLKDPYYLAIHSLIYRLLWSPRSRTEKYPFIVFVGEWVTPEQRQLLSGAGAIVRELQSLEWNPNVEGVQPRWKDLFAKLNMWRETEFDKIMFLDGDAFPTSNLDEIFDVTDTQECIREKLGIDDFLGDGDPVCEPYVFAGVPQNPDRETDVNINVGSMIFTPSDKMHARLLQNYVKTDHYDCLMAEQAFLNWQFNINGAFPGKQMDRTWGGAFPKDNDEGTLKVVHEKLWAAEKGWLKAEWETRWGEMVLFYMGDEFGKRRKEDGLIVRILGFPMYKYPPPRSTILSTDFRKSKTTLPKPKFWQNVRQRYRSARIPGSSSKNSNTKINDDGLCTRCADLDLDAIFTETMTPVSDWCPFHVEEILEIGVLHPNCRLCNIFGHCSAVEVDKLDSSSFGEARYSLLKCTTSAILEDNGVSPDVWMPENLLTVCLESDFEMGARADDYHRHGFVVQYSNLEDSKSALHEQRQMIDFQLLSSWFNTCNSLHKDCHDSADWISESPVFLIDCDDRKVDLRIPGTHYAALSLPSALPKLIEDAIFATKALGLKYLWIDRYCIAQNDKDVKHKQIASMDQIYSHADVTLIAVVNDPEEGLPGVNNTPRPLRPSSEFGKYRFASTMRDPAELISESTWNQRAWTYQEAFLANRKIFFTREGAQFECRSMFRSEHLDKYIIKQSGLIEDVLVFPTWQRKTSYTITQDVNLISLHHRYCRRNMTFQSDAINAFRGILNLYDKGPLPTKNYWGMPIMALLDSDSTGSNANETNELYPEFDSVLSLTARFMASVSAAIQKDARRRTNFPSWTWAGWYEQSFCPSAIDKRISDVEVWIETSDCKVHTLHEFVAADGFNLPQSQLSPYIHLEAMMAPIRIFSFDTSLIVGAKMTYHFTRTWVEFDGKDGSLLYAQADYSSTVKGECWKPDRPAQYKNYLAIVMGKHQTYRGFTEHVILLVEEHNDVVEKVGTLDVERQLSKHPEELYSWEPTALKGVDGVLHGSDYFDMDEIVWTRRRVKLG
ncbi:glycosyltransferase family 8 protein [Amniculicola lignicola CBS 123094]|uniref:Glycosyltransferase family 8 protein n=1 Tax=Amniculicola lignicola CBS 123094 TaxID=1392246 RepID=A0A6A5W248_9PLEO|nr:glycosyltransferase family 8 protein [Amniculicola lignicola CBS 123094]